METRIAIGSDHAGFELKQQLIQRLREKGFEVKDFGTYSAESCDYPDIAHPLAQSVDRGESPWGVLICGSANGVAMTANKYPHVRAAIAWNNEVAALARRHNNANILCLPARFISPEEAWQCTLTFFSEPFEGGRHERRVEKIACS
ncbi:MAG: ribose 5-phosphate isomerase B [Chitinophagales bacterium]|nr:ribose 5-phosphate isomerase B [Chitinophagales bacterium]MDW8274317.1 ribose 5-phosphate isomerase B [Chitinophagales bacterium]